MRTLRALYRLFRLASMLYTVWRGSRVTRAVWVATWIWRMFQRRSVKTTPPRVMISFMDPNSSALYRRRGWRRIGRRSDTVK